MNSRSWTLVIFAFASSIGFAQVAATGPFGFERGMTKERLIKLVGQGAVKENKGDSLILTTAPRPHADFEEYILTVSPELGLLKISAIGENVRTNGFGTELRDSFIELRDTVSKTYGVPETYDFLRQGSLWEERQYWMIGLLKGERTLASFWHFASALQNHVTAMKIEATALSQEKGYVTLGYEFRGFAEYHDAKKAKAGSVF